MKVPATMGSYFIPAIHSSSMRSMKDTLRQGLPLAGTVIVLAACLLAAGCTGEVPGEGDNETVQGADLNSTAWNLVSYVQDGSMVNTLEGTTVTLTFGENATVSGSTGCNSYSASYTMNATAITIGPAASTLMYCPEEGVMEQENVYLRLLGTVKTYDVTGEVLTFFDENSTAVLVFEPYLPSVSETLSGTPWEMGE